MLLMSVGVVFGLFIVMFALLAIFSVLSVILHVADGVIHLAMYYPKFFLILVTILFVGFIFYAMHH